MNYSRQWEALLDEIDEFLEDHEDVRDGSDGQPLPNKAMSLLTSLRYLRPTDAQANVARPEGERNSVIEECAAYLESFYIPAPGAAALIRQLKRSKSQRQALKPKPTIFNTPSPNIVDSTDAASSEHQEGK